MTRNAEQFFYPDHKLKQVALSRGEYDRACELLGRVPTDVELGMIGALWSEHCGYKHSRGLFHHFPTTGERVVTTLGAENAGAVDIGDGWIAVMKIESHNHPTAVEPYQGAATGVGGIVRDIFAMGAQPVALLDSLRFGPLEQRRNKQLFQGAVEGIGGYGNCLGVPTVGGEVVFDNSYSGNPLVNAMCLGVTRREHFISATTGPAGTKLVLVGAETGRDGLHGATFASVEIDSSGVDNRPAVQVGAPFLENLLMNACVGLVREHHDWIEGLQDCGAAGLTSATVEMAERAGTGIVLYTNRVPRRERGMTPYEVMLSESQERMIVAVKPQHINDVVAWFEYHEVSATVIGDVTADGVARVLDEQGNEVAFAPVSVLTNAPLYTPTAQYSLRKAFDPATLLNFSSTTTTDALLEMLKSPNVASKRWVWEQYDHQVGTNTVITPGADAAVLRIRGVEHALALCTDGPGRAVELNPRVGAMRAVAEAARNVACVGAQPIAVTDCLNFGNPERPDVYFQLRESVLGIADACRVFGTPVVSGNVSLYNEFEGNSVLPTPVVGMLGLLEKPELAVRPHFRNQGDVVFLLGSELAQPVSSLGASEYLAVLHNLTAGDVSVDLDAERALVQCLVAGSRNRLFQSAHDCSKGGLAVALAESAMGGKLGVRIRGVVGDRLDVTATLFGEAGGRAVVSVSPSATQRLHTLAQKHQVPCAEIGVVQGDRLIIDPVIDVAVTEIAEVWENALFQTMRQ